jgi:hypothetical protein
VNVYIRRDAAGNDFMLCACVSALGDFGFLLGVGDAVALIDHEKPPFDVWGRTTRAILLTAAFKALDETESKQLANVRDATRARKYANSVMKKLNLEAAP